jgi:hypothetical protein
MQAVRSTNGFLLLTVEQCRHVTHIFFWWWGLIYARWNNRLRQHPFIVFQQSAPFHCKQLPASLIAERAVLSYRRQLIWPFVLKGHITADYSLHFLQEEVRLLWRISSPGQFKHVAATWRQFTSFDLQVIQYLNRGYEYSWTGRGCRHIWPSRSPDFIPVDICLLDTWRTWWIWGWSRRKMNFYGA